MDSIDRFLQLDQTLAEGKPAPATLADLMAMVAASAGVSETAKATMASAIRRVAKMAALPPAAVRADCGTLSALLYSRPPAGHDLTRASFANLLSSLRRALRLAGLHAPHLQGDQGISAPWQQVFDATDTERQQWPVLRLARWASSAGLPPGAIAAEHRDQFAAWLRGNVIISDAAAKALQAFRAYRSIAEAKPGLGLPRVDPARRRAAYTVPIDAMLAAFQADVRTFLERMSRCPLTELYDDGPTAGRSRQGPASRATIKARAFQIRQAASALVHSGIAREQIQNLRDLVEPTDRAFTIIRFFVNRACGTLANSQTHGVASVLRIIARHHARLPDAAVEKIAKLAGKVAPEKGQGLTAKNRERLRLLIEPHRRARLLLLPETLMREATELRESRPAEAVRLAGIAAVVEIATICPLRLRNQAELRLDQHLRRGGHAGKLITHLVIDKADVKNGQAIEWPVPPESARLLDRFISEFRPLLPHAGGPFLLPGREAPMRPPGSLGQALKRELTIRVGSPVNVHLLRHFAAWLYLSRHPGDYGSVRRILGHKSEATTIAHYVGLETDAAAHRFDQHVLQERKLARAHARRRR